MSDSCNTTFYSLVIHNILHICSTLFITTSLLFLALLTGLANDNFSDALDPEKDGHDGSEDGVYESVFGSSGLQPSGSSGLTTESEEKISENFLMMLNHNAEENTVEKLHKSEWTASRGSEVKVDKVKSTTTGSSVKSIDSEKEHGPTIEANSQPLDSDHLGSHGSMRKEKEWNRTLACKLFEERRKADGDEGMDSLWEAYENDLTTSKTEDAKTKDKKMKEDEVSEDGEGAEVDVQLCCLQALRFSSRKMNLGIGKPSLVRMSKAIKGIGWLRHAKRHSKKVHNNGD